MYLKTYVKEMIVLLKNIDQLRKIIKWGNKKYTWPNISAFHLMPDER